MKPMKAISNLIFFLFVSQGIAFADTKLTSNQINRIKQNVFETSSKQDFVTFTRLTSESDIKSCELEFQKTLSDTRGMGEEIYVVKGSLSSHYIKDKFRNVVMLKVNPAKLNLEKIESLEKMGSAWTIVKPDFSTAILNGTNLRNFENSSFECDSGGLCVAFADDEKLRLTQTLMSKKQNSLKIVFNFEKGSYDKSFEVSNLSKNYPIDKASFNVCQLEILEKIRVDMKESLKK